MTTPQIEPGSPAAYRVFKDGNEWCAVAPGFIDLQQSPSAFADTPARALAKLLALAEPDMRAICEALGFDPTNHHNAAKCPYCRPTQAPQAADAIDARERPITKADVLRVAKEIGLVGWISDCGEWFEFTETQQPSKLLIQFAEHYAAVASRQEAPPAAGAAQAPALPEGWKLVEKKTCYVLQEGNSIVATLAGPDAELNANRIASALAATPATEPFQKALDIRIEQGWQLGGNACPVLYTDTINGEQVRRDDLWLATTAGLKGAND